MSGGEEWRDTPCGESTSVARRRVLLTRGEEVQGNHRGLSNKADSLKKALRIVIGVAVYGYYCYVLLLTFAWLSNIGHHIPAVGLVFPRGIDDNEETNSGYVWTVIHNILLLGLFAVQHSGMAREATKELIHKVIPFYMARSLYVLCASAILHFITIQWKPLPMVLYDIGAPWSTVMWTISAIGFLQMFLSTFMIDHFDLFGLRQVYMGDSYLYPPLVVSYLYKYVRHPLYLGFLIHFFFAPIMTVGRLLFVLILSAYIVAGIHLEERDLIHFLGVKYEEYRREVPMLIPKLTHPFKLQPHYKQV